ncbi:MAG: prenyltransferase/squalene oxidase repeat-containing protein [Gemmataceae bacterium]
MKKLLLASLVALALLWNLGLTLHGVVDPADKLDPAKLPRRDPVMRQNAVKTYGGTEASEAAVERGLKWIVAHQAPDGHWSLQKFRETGRCNCGGAGAANNDVAATVFGLWPLLGAGHTQKPALYKGQTYSKEVDKALRWFVVNQDRDGAFAPESGEMYSHSLATIALCEAYGLTGDANLKPAAQRAVNFLVAAQTAEGGWRYRPKSTGYDGSIGGWAMSALHTARLAGLTVPDENWKRTAKWLDAAASPDGGRYGYTSAHPANGLRAATTSEGLLSRIYLGANARNQDLLAGLPYLRAHKFRANDIYYSHAATQVMFHLGGQYWSEWNTKMLDSLPAAQDQGDKVPHQKGSWFDQTDAISSGRGGRLMQTALSVLTLEVYYRHVPLLVEKD